MFRIITAIATALPATVFAQTFEMDPDSAVEFVRCTDLSGLAYCELVVPDTDAYYRCIALDGSDEPLGVATVQGAIPAVYDQLDATLIDRVICDRLPA